METRYYLGYRYPRTRRGRVCALPVGLGRPDPPYQFARPDARPEPWRIVRARRSCRMCDLCRACLLPLLRSLGHGLCTRPLRRTARHPIGDRAGTSGRDPAEPFSSIAVLPRSSKRVAVSKCPPSHEMKRGVWTSSFTQSIGTPASRYNVHSATSPSAASSNPASLTSRPASRSARTLRPRLSVVRSLSLSPHHCR